jgi:hypothetical protein
MMSIDSVERPSVRVIRGGEDDEDDDTVELELNEAAVQLLTEAALLAQPASEEQAEQRLTPDGSEGGISVVEPGEGVGREAPAPPERPASIPRAPREIRRFALGLGMLAVAAGLLGGVAYLATATAPARGRHLIPSASIVANNSSVSVVVAEAPPLTSTNAQPTSAPPVMSAPPAIPDADDDSPVRYKNPFDAAEVFEFPAGITAIQARDAVAELLLQRALERKSLLVRKPQRSTNTVDQRASVTASRVTPRS